MNRRYGLFEPATFVCAAVLLWPFVYADTQLIPRAFALVPHPPYLSAPACLIVQTASIAFVGLQLLIAYVVAFQLCRWLQSTLVTLSLPQLRLTTVIVLTVVAGIIVGLFVKLHRAWLTRPDAYAWQWAGKVWAWIPPGLVLLFGISQSCEGWHGWNRTMPAQSPSANDAATPLSRWWAAQLADRSEPTLRERLLYALPLLGFIALVVIAPSLIQELNYRRLRVDLPVFGRSVVYWTGSGHAYLCATLVIVLGVYMAWICRTRKRMALFALLLLFMLLGSLFAFLLTLVMPLTTFESFCVVEGEPVDTPNGPRPIESLRVGDAIICCDAAGQRVTGRVEAVFVHSAKEYLSLVCGAGLVLRVTAAHPIATPSGYRPAGELKLGDAVLTREGVKTIVTRGSISANVRVYDLSVAPYPNFYAAGVLVHNKLRKK